VSTVVLNNESEENWGALGGLYMTNVHYWLSATAGTEKHKGLIAFVLN